MKLCVFQEFKGGKQVLDAVKAALPAVDVDQHDQPMPTKTPEEETVVATNAKLLFGTTDSVEAVDAVVATLVKKHNFVVVDRHPVTSAGCAMEDRVILSYP